MIFKALLFFLIATHQMSGIAAGTEPKARPECDIPSYEPVALKANNIPLEAARRAFSKVVDITEELYKRLRDSISLKVLSKILGTGIPYILSTVSEAIDKINEHTSLDPRIKELLRIAECMIRDVANIGVKLIKCLAGANSEPIRLCICDESNCGCPPPGEDAPVKPSTPDKKISEEQRLICAQNKLRDTIEITAIIGDKLAECESNVYQTLADVYRKQCRARRIDRCTAARKIVRAFSAEDEIYNRCEQEALKELNDHSAEIDRKHKICIKTSEETEEHKIPLKSCGTPILHRIRDLVKCLIKKIANVLQINICKFQSSINDILASVINRKLSELDSSA